MVGEGMRPPLGPMGASPCGFGRGMQTSGTALGRNQTPTRLESRWQQKGPAWLVELFSTPGGTSKRAAQALLAGSRDMTGIQAAHNSIVAGTTLSKVIGKLVGRLSAA